MGEPRGVFCNMGTCGQCTVTLLPEGRRLRACIVPVQPGMEVMRD
jgi:sarcosine oxidase subunit alpha